MTHPAIQIHDVSKRFRLGGTGGVAGVRGWFRRRRNNGDEAFWALRGVSMEVERGEVFGLVGHNGAGKSTLLKLLARITEPSGGRITLHGRVGSLLEVGTGFHPELTGRENVFLNGAILGLSRREIRAQFDAIVAFSEVEAFLDTPVKRYSSGMRVRLAFAVAAHLQPEILLVDEVLAVGDAAFQAKCLGKMGEVARGGRTIVLVSHNMAAIGRLCSRAAWLDRGQLRDVGDARDVVRRYLAADLASGASVSFAPEPGKTGQILRLEVVDRHGEAVRQAPANEPFAVRVTYRLAEPCRGYRVGIALRLPDGTDVYTTSSADTAGALWESGAGDHTAYVTIPASLLAEGRYLVSCFLGQPPLRRLDARENAWSIDVVGQGRGLGGERLPGVIALPLPWTRIAA